MRMIVAYSQYVRKIGCVCFLDPRVWFLILESGTKLFFGLVRQARVSVSKKYSNLNLRDCIGYCGPFTPEESCDEVEMCLEDIWNAHHFAPLLDHTPKRPQFLEPELGSAARSGVTSVVGYRARFNRAAGARHF